MTHPLQDMFLEFAESEGWVLTDITVVDSKTGEPCVIKTLKRKGDKDES